ncbi:DUF7848 domain-containing protein [Streptomyces albidoflavus]
MPRWSGRPSTTPVGPPISPWRSGGIRTGRGGRREGVAAARGVAARAGLAGRGSLRRVRRLRGAVACDARPGREGGPEDWCIAHSGGHPSHRAFRAFVVSARRTEPDDTVGDPSATG